MKFSSCSLPKLYIIAATTSKVFALRVLENIKKNFRETVKEKNDEVPDTSRHVYVYIYIYRYLSFSLSLSLYIYICICIYI